MDKQQEEARKERILAALVETKAFKSVLEATLKPYKDEAEQAKTLSTNAMRAQVESQRQIRIKDIDLRLHYLNELGVPRSSLDLARHIIVSEEAAKEVAIDFNERGEVTEKTSVEDLTWKLLEQQAGTVPPPSVWRGTTDLTEDEEEHLWKLAEEQFGEVWTGVADKSDR